MEFFRSYTLCGFEVNLFVEKCMYLRKYICLMILEFIFYEVKRK